MQIEKLQYRQVGTEVPCFRYHGMAAEYEKRNRFGFVITDQEEVKNA